MDRGERAVYAVAHVHHFKLAECASSSRVNLSAFEHSNFRIAAFITILTTASTCVTSICARY